MLTGPPPKFHGTWDILLSNAAKIPRAKRCSGRKKNTQTAQVSHHSAPRHSQIAQD